MVQSLYYGQYHVQQMLFLLRIRSIDCSAARQQRAWCISHEVCRTCIICITCVRCIAMLPLASKWEIFQGRLLCPKWSLDFAPGKCCYTFETLSIPSPASHSLLTPSSAPI